MSIPVSAVDNASVDRIDRKLRVRPQIRGNARFLPDFIDIPDWNHGKAAVVIRLAHAHQTKIHRYNFLTNLYIFRIRMLHHDLLLDNGLYLLKGNHLHILLQDFTFLHSVNP